MRAVLRYRRIPFHWIRRGAAEDVGIPEVPVALIPVLVFPGEAGAPDEAMIDSTFQIQRLETLYRDRAVVPPDPALAYLDALIEDYADEWLTKAMFHYRWSYAPDIEKAARVLPLERQIGLRGERFEQAARGFADRQISRLGVVGSNETTKPVIEESYLRLLQLLDAHLPQAPFLMGGRPGAGDFGLQGQLSQLALFDPTSVALTEREAPRVIAWLNQLHRSCWRTPRRSRAVPRRSSARSPVASGRRPPSGIKRSACSGCAKAAARSTPPTAPSWTTSCPAPAARRSSRKRREPGPRCSRSSPRPAAGGERMPGRSRSPRRASRTASPRRAAAGRSRSTRRRRRAHER
jgi:glutathione S-transferase